MNGDRLGDAFEQQRAWFVPSRQLPCQGVDQESQLAVASARNVAKRARHLAHRVPSLRDRGAAARDRDASPRRAPTSHPYFGRWGTADRRIRHELSPDGRYDEARGSKESAYRGRYEVNGDLIKYWDDTGFKADGDFVDGVLYHGGMVLRRER